MTRAAQPERLKQGARKASAAARATEACKVFRSSRNRRHGARPCGLRGRLARSPLSAALPSHLVHDGADALDGAEGREPRGRPRELLRHGGLEARLGALGREPAVRRAPGSEASEGWKLVVEVVPSERDAVRCPGRAVEIVDAHHIVVHRAVPFRRVELPETDHVGRG